MKSFLLAVGMFFSTSALAVDDPEWTLSPQEMAAVLSTFQSDIKAVGCAELSPISGNMTGGATPLSTSQFITIKLAFQNPPGSSVVVTASSTLIISSHTAGKSTKLSFECIAD